MELKYQLDERPPLRALVLFGLQWLAIALPGIIIIGRVVAAIYSPGYEGQIAYLQKLSLATAIVLGVQILWGHRLPLILGPASVLLVGVVASQGANPAAVHTAFLVGGALLALISMSGLFSVVQRLFTVRVVAVVLLLIAFSLAPTILRLVTTPAPGHGPGASLVFTAILLVLLFAGNRWLAGILKSTLIVWGMAAGTVAWLLLYPQALPIAEADPRFFKVDFFSSVTTTLVFNPGLLISFFFCYLALAVNDLGSIQALDPLLRPSRMDQRINRGMAVTGLGNVLSGFLGVIGPVNFSLSPGVIASTGCASRYTLLPTAAALLLLSFSPLAVGLLGAVPPVVIGAILVYILTAQIAAGLSLLAGPEFTFQHGITVGFSILVGTLVSFLPAEVTGTFPSLLRPVLANGFVMGVIAVLILEHGLFRD